MKSGGKYGVYTPMTDKIRINGEWEMLPTVSLKNCEYLKDYKVLRLSRQHIGMPRQFFVQSHVTGKQVRFVVVGPEDRLFDSDQWDGEQQVYRPVGDVPGVDHMVIHSY